MPTLQKLSWKAPVAQSGPAVTPDNFFKLFNAWIPESPEVYIDVADYQHVPEGPKTYLAGHHASVAYDNTHGVYGLLYTRKRYEPGSNAQRVRSSFGEFLKACRRSETDALFEGALQWDRRTFYLICGDRALSSNTKETFQAVLSEVLEALQPWAQGGEVACESAGASGERLTLKIVFEKPISLETPV